VQGLQRYGDSKINGTVWLAKGWAVHGDHRNQQMCSGVCLKASIQFKPPHTHTLSRTHIPPCRTFCPTSAEPHTATVQTSTYSHSLTHAHTTVQDILLNIRGTPHSYSSNLHILTLSHTRTYHRAGHFAQHPRNTTQLPASSPQQQSICLRTSPCAREWLHYPARPNRSYPMHLYRCV